MIDAPPVDEGADQANTSCASPVVPTTEVGAPGVPTNTEDDAVAEFAQRENLYVLNEGSLKRVKKDSDFFINTMANQKEAINQYIRTNKLNFKNEEQLKKLVEFYNSL